jgi:GntR family transcriptional regulator, transcriptional repressor for pyruvate dehydrogenase complex
MTIDTPFSPLQKSQSVAEQISARILDLLRQKELKAGDKLPPERELAEMLEVSRPSLREALRALSIMKIIEVRQGDGTYVSSLKPEELVEHLEFIFLLDDSTMLQLFEARKIVEAGNAALAAQRISETDLAALEGCLERAEAVANDPEAFMLADIELHEIITRAAANPLLERFMASISILGRASRRKTTSMSGVTAASLVDHRQIVAALQVRDPAAASAAMLHHLEHVEQAYRQSLAAELPEEGWE